MTPDYRFYQELYRGRKLSEEQFPEYIARGQEAVERLCRGCRVTPAENLLARYTPEQLFGLAACAVAEVVLLYEKAAQAGESQSATVGAVSYSTNREQPAASLLGSQSHAVAQAAGRYLDIYRGVC